MKRDAFFSTDICFLAIAVIISVSFMFLPSSAGAAVGRFTLVEGTVDLLKGGNLPAIPAKINLSVEEKDIIRTKSASRAEITMADSTILRIAQRSRIDINEYSASDHEKKNVVKLDRGKVEAVVEKKPVVRINIGAQANSFEIHTPNAVAGVRGTAFFVSYEKNVSITLVKDGNVCVSNINSPANAVCMPPNFITSVVGAHNPAQPKAATASETNFFESQFRGSGSAVPGLDSEVLSAGSAPTADTTISQGGNSSTENPATITDLPVIIPITETIPNTIDSSDKYPLNAIGAFSETPDITGTGTLSPAGNTASIALSGSYIPGSENNNWVMNVMTSGTTGPFFEADLLGTQWSNKSLAASAAGYWIDSTPATPTTGIFIGETKGTYNPTTSTWQAAVQGSWLETNNYLGLTATDAGRSTLANLNIPAVEVGRINLSGSIGSEGNTGLDIVSIFMPNVIFFAPSTGQKPALWATNTITGSYDFSNGSALNAATITNPANVIPLYDGNAIFADFQVTQWQSGKWVGKVSNGTGDLSGGTYTGPVNFKGGAAGTLTGTTSGTLSGTAAGTVK